MKSKQARQMNVTQKDGNPVATNQNIDDKK